MLDGLAPSALDWWREAGVDTFVEETPRNWLAPARPDAPVAAAPAAEPAPAVATPPGDLAAFRAWLLADGAVPGRAAARFDAEGDPASGTMVVIDMPEAEDRAQRRLLGGAAGALFDRMLGAMSLTRAAIYLAPFSPARPASGRLDAAAVATLAPLLRHHVALAAPRRLLLLGDGPARALLDLAPADARGRAHGIAIGGRDVATVATFPPRFLLQPEAPDLKGRRAAVWADLQLFMAL